MSETDSKLFNLMEKAKKCQTVEERKLFYNSLTQDEKDLLTSIFNNMWESMKVLLNSISDPIKNGFKSWYETLSSDQESYLRKKINEQ